MPKRFQICNMTFYRVTYIFGVSLRTSQKLTVVPGKSITFGLGQQVHCGCDLETETGSLLMR